MASSAPDPTEVHLHPDAAAPGFGESRRRRHRWHRMERLIVVGMITAIALFVLLLFVLAHWAAES
jgi:hypothetical protein